MTHRDPESIVLAIDEHIMRQDLVARGPQIRVTRDGFSARLAADIIGEGTTVDEALSSLLDVLEAREAAAPTAPPSDLDALDSPDCEECFGDGCNACEPGRFCVECRADFAIGEMCGHAYYADNANERGAA